MPLWVILIEIPQLDCDAHKKHFLGTTKRALSFLFLLKHGLIILLSQSYYLHNGKTIHRLLKLKKKSNYLYLSRFLKNKSY